MIHKRISRPATESEPTPAWQDPRTITKAFQTCRRDDTVEVWFSEKWNTATVVAVRQYGDRRWVWARVPGDNSVVIYRPDEQWAVRWPAN